MKKLPATTQYNPKGQRVRVFEVPSQKRDREERPGEGKQSADECLAADAVAERAEQVGNLDEPCKKDHRRCEQEREAGRVLVVESPKQACDASLRRNG